VTWRLKIKVGHTKLHYCDLVNYTATKQMAMEQSKELSNHCPRNRKRHTTPNPQKKFIIVKWVLSELSKVRFRRNAEKFQRVNR